MTPNKLNALIETARHARDTLNRIDFRDADAAPDLLAFRRMVEGLLLAAQIDLEHLIADLKNERRNVEYFAELDATLNEVNQWGGDDDWKADVRWLARGSE